MISIIGATHPGQRDHNEDCFAADPELGIGLVADGMGGYACGEVASELVKLTVSDAIANNEGLREGIGRAHAVVKEAAAADASKQGMGSTAIALKMQGLDYEVGWVGDSRAYLWNKEAGELKQITRDHSYVETLLSTGAITHEEAINHPNRNLITQAVGVSGEDGLEIGLVHGRLGSGEQLMLCSDGLVDEVLDYDIAKLMLDAANPEEALHSLVRAAVVAGGHDNITVVIVSADEGDDIAPAIEPEIVRSTRLSNEPEHPTMPRPSASVDITRMGQAVAYVEEEVEEDVDELEEAGLWLSIMDFVDFHGPKIFAAVVLVVSTALAAFYFI